MYFNLSSTYFFLSCWNSFPLSQQYTACIFMSQNIFLLKQIFGVFAKSTRSWEQHRQLHTSWKCSDQSWKLSPGLLASSGMQLQEAAELQDGQTRGLSWHPAARQRGQHGPCPCTALMLTIHLAHGNDHLAMRNWRPVAVYSALASHVFMCKQQIPPKMDLKNTI